MLAKSPRSPEAIAISMCLRLAYRWVSDPCRD